MSNRTVKKRTRQARSRDTKTTPSRLRRIRADFDPKTQPTAKPGDFIFDTRAGLYGFVKSATDKAITFAGNDGRDHDAAVKDAEVTPRRFIEGMQQTSTDRELEEAITDKLDRDSLARLNEVSAPPHPVAAARREQTARGHRFNAELKPGIVIHDRPGKRIGVVWHAFNGLDLCVYMAQDGKLYHCRIQDVFIEPRPTGEGARYFFPLHLQPPTAYPADTMKPMQQIDGVLIKIGDLLSALRAIAVPAELHRIAEYPASVREHLSHAVSEINEWRANWMDELIGNTEAPGGFDQPLRSAKELKAAGAAYVA